jgi:drug/metabolite transporter (DMT)-like permease
VPDRRIVPDMRNAYLSLLVTMALFGSAFAGSKVVVEQMPHQVAALLRFGGAALILLVIVLARGRRGPRLTWRQAVRCGLVGLLGVFAYNVFFFWALTLAPSIDGSVIVPVLSPVLTAAALLVARAERTTPARAAGLLLGLSGAAIFLAGIRFGGPRLLGDLLFLLGAAAWAGYSIASKRILTGVDPLRATTVATAVGATALLIPAVPVLPATDWGAVSGTAWATLAYLAAGPTALAYLLYYRGLAKVSPSTATVMMFAVPLFGLTCSTLLLHESFTPTQVLGAAVMVPGALLAAGILHGRSRAAAGFRGRFKAAPHDQAGQRRRLTVDTWPSRHRFRRRGPSA